MPSYLINQFLVDCAFPLPCPIASSTGERDTVEDLPVRVEREGLHEFTCVHWIAMRNGENFLCAYDVGDRLLIRAGNLVKMAVDRHGRTLMLDFDADNSTAMAYARALTINLGVSLCTLQRGDLPLHAAGAEIDGKLIGIMAPSGTGKSTLLWTLLDQGAMFANDDVIPVQSRQNCLIATPSRSLPSKLSRQALETRGWDCSQYEESLPGNQEFWIPIATERRLMAPRPLTALFVLRPFRHPEPPGQIKVCQHAGPASVSLLMEHTQGLWAAYGHVDAPRLFSRYLAVAQSIPIYSIEYHRCLEMLPEIVAILRNILAQPVPQQAHVDFGRREKLRLRFNALMGRKGRNEVNR